MQSPSFTASTAITRDQPGHALSTEELRAALASPHPPRVLEILGAQHFQTGHLPGALNLPLEGFDEGAARMLPDLGAELVVYCASDTCQNSQLAERKLRSLGYRNVRVYPGGKAAWKAAGLPLEGGGALRAV